MKSESATAADFEATPEFRHFKETMRKLITVPKAELDRQVKEYGKRSPKTKNVTRARKAPIARD